MKAEQRKEIETNSIVLLIQRWRRQITWRTAYYAIGVVALVVAAILLYRHFTGESRRARDSILDQLDSANTPEKLKEGMETHRGTVYGSLFKIQLARYLLKNDGLPKLGTDVPKDQQQAGNAVTQARDYYLELTSELKEKEQAALVQESWIGAARAEEAMVGLPSSEGGSDSRGNVDKAIEYYEKAGAIFPDTEFSKRYKERAEMLKSKKDQFVTAQKEFYKPIERPIFPSGKTDPFAPPIPNGPKLDIPGLPPLPGEKRPEVKAPELPKIEVPPIPEKGPSPRKVGSGKETLKAK